MPLPVLKSSLAWKIIKVPREGSFTLSKDVSVDPLPMQMMPSACGTKVFTLGVTEAQIGRPVKEWYLTTHDDEVPVLKPHVWPVWAACAGIALAEVRAM